MSNKINPETLTMEQLLALVSPPAHVTKLPKAETLLGSDEEVLFTFSDGGANVTVYKNGYLVYERDGHATVTTVQRCASPTYALHPSSEEEKEGGHVVGCLCHFKRTKNGLFLISQIPESEMAQENWIVPVRAVCEVRLTHNQEVREESMSEFSLSDGDPSWEKCLACPDPFDAMIERENEAERMRKKKEQLDKLRAAQDKLTPRQREVVHYYFFKNMGQDKIAAELGISQPAVSKCLKAALKNLKKEMEK